MLRLTIQAAFEASVDPVRIPLRREPVRDFWSVQFDVRHRGARQISVLGKLCEGENPLVNGVLFQIRRLRLGQGADP